jgi:hypothetical protein
VAYARRVHETPEDLEELRAVLERSYASAGEHLLSIHSDRWRLGAEQIVERLTGMVILSLATVSSKGQPVIAPVDGMFYRGRFWFGSSPASVRATHIKRNPNVSAGHIEGEQLAVIAHGTALEVGYASAGSHLLSIHADQWRMGASIDHFWKGDAVYWELEPRKMFALAPQTGEGT